MNFLKSRFEKRRLSIVLILLVFLVSNVSCFKINKVDEKENTNNDVNIDVNVDTNKDENKLDENEQESDDEDINSQDKNDNEEIKLEQISLGNTSNDGKQFNVNGFDVEDMVRFKYDGEYSNQKIIFLTFDDGPSENTSRILEILNRQNVHATFFILGNQIAGKENLIEDIYNSGNAIGNHTYTHEYNSLYPNNTVNIENFMNEYYKTEEKLKEILGDGFSSNVVRMPGGENSRLYRGDKNLAILKERLKSEGISSVDWNALNGDAEGKKRTKEEMLDYLKSTAENKNNVVVLMHDTNFKGITVEMLEEAIIYFKEEGYEFKTIC